MKLSPLQLSRHVVPQISCRANADFKPEADVQALNDTFAAEAEVFPLESKDPAHHSSWGVELDLRHADAKASNSPYEFEIKLVGFFRCNNKPGDVPTEVFVQTNGSSILFGIARELLRSLTAAGPWGELILPTVSFYDPAALPEKAASAKARKRKA